jgi:fused signal recognition particle receptor
MGLFDGIQRTRERLAGGLTKLLLGKPATAEQLLEEIETLLLTADVGVEATERIVTNLGQRASRAELGDADRLFAALQQEMTDLLTPVAVPLAIEPTPGKPYVVLIVGVNGSGKTTTVAKLARRFQGYGYSLALAAADTFRAAAVDQLRVWAERHGVSLTAHRDGGDPAAVAYEALETAQARNKDILLVDTAGRLHTQANLMEQLKKIRRVLTKLDADAPHETLLVLDATTGQNALQQAQQFHAAIGITGLVLTKLDGTAKGGIIFALAEQLGIPIRYVGVGETAQDLRDFEAQDFVNALLGTH